MKRILSFFLSLSILFMCSMPAFATEPEDTSHPLSENLMQYLQNDDNKRLLLWDNYGYMSFVKDYQNNKKLQTIAKAADLFTGIGTEPDETKYIEVLITLYALYEQENAADMSEQKNLDNQTGGANYVAKIAATAADTAAAWFGASMPTNEMVDMLSKVLGGLSTAAKNIDVAIDALSDLEVLVQNYVDYDSFLAMIEENSSGALKNAASTLRAEMQAMMDLRLTTYDEAVQESGSNLRECLMSDWFIDLCKNVPKYQGDAQMQKILGTCSDFFKLKQAWDAGSAIGMFVADAVVGGEKLISRLHEMMALYEISLILQTELLDLNSEFFDTYASDESDQLAARYISFSNYLIAARLRGEYCLYSVVATDAGLLGWMHKEDREDAAAWYERQYGRIQGVKKTVGALMYVSEDPEEDFAMFQDMLDETASVWWNSNGISSSEATISQIINEYVLSFALPWGGLYSYYCDREHEDVEWLYQREDPLHRFEYGAFALDAEEVEWIVTKVFCAEFDPNASGKTFYFHEGNLYIQRKLGYGGGSWVEHTISEVRAISEQKYEIVAVADLHVEKDSVEWSERYHFVAQLQYDGIKGNYWEIEEFSKDNDNFGRTVEKN